jgi:hypothetical protein
MITNRKPKSKKRDDGKCPDCGEDSMHVPLRNDPKCIDTYLLHGRCQKCQDGKTRKRIEC